MGYKGLGRRSRPCPEGGYKQETYTDEKIHINLTLSREDHLAICAKLPGRKMNRTEWIQEAVREKLEREKNGI